MQASVDKLFEEGDVFNSSCRDVLPSIKERPSPCSPSSSLTSPVFSQPSSVPPSREKSPERFKRAIPQKKVPSPPRSLGTVLPSSSSHFEPPARSFLPVNQSMTSQDMGMSGLWREFNKQKQMFEKLVEEPNIGTPPAPQARHAQYPSLPNNLAQGEKLTNYSTPPVQPQSLSESKTKYLTPVNQMGQRNFPDPHKLTTSTPKGNYFRERQAGLAGNVLDNDDTPNASPIYSANNTLNEQDHLSGIMMNSFNSATCSTIHQPGFNNTTQHSFLGRRVWPSPTS